MEKIKVLHLAHLRNAGHGQFNSEIVGIVNKYTPATKETVKTATPAKVSLWRKKIVISTGGRNLLKENL